MVKKGRNNTGPQDGHNNGNAKLSAEEVAKIKECIILGMNNKVIAEIFEITHSLVSLIRRGKLWGNVPLTKKYSSIIKQTTDNALEEK
jgi:ribosomal protein S4E